MSANELSSPSRRAARWDTFHCLSIIGILISYLFFILSPIHDYKIPNLILNPLAVALLAVAAFRGVGKALPMLLPSMLFMLWYYCVQALGGDYYLLSVESLVRLFGLAIAWLLFYGTPLLLDQERLEKLASAFAHILTGVLGIFAWMGVFACLTGTPIRSPFTEYTLSLGKDGRLYLFHLHANFAATLFLIALCCGVYLLTRAKHPLHRLLVSSALPGLLLAIALTGSRTVYIVTAISAGMLAFLLIFRNPTLRKTKRPLLLGLIALVLAGGLTFLSFPAAGGLISRYLTEKASKGDGIAITFAATPKKAEKNASGAKPTKAAEATPKATATKAASTKATATKTPKPTKAAVTGRNLFQELTTMATRTDSYEALWQVLQQEPDILWRGRLFNGFMDSVNQARAEEDSLYAVVNMHSSPLETLLLMGLPGLLIVLVWVGLLIVQCVRLFFSDTAALSAQIWVILVTALLVNGLTESYLFVQNNLINLVLFFAAGMVMIHASRSLPPLKGGGRSDPPLSGGFAP